MTFERGDIVCCERGIAVVVSTQPKMHAKRTDLVCLNWIIPPPAPDNLGRSWDYSSYLEHDDCEYHALVEDVEKLGRLE